MGQEGKVYFHCVRKHVMVHENLFVQEFSAQIVIVLTGRPDVWTGPVWICVFYTLSEAKSKFVPCGTPDTLNIENFLVFIF